MPGRIRDSDIAQVRERARIDEVIGEYVALRRGGAGSLKGLCPFHDERTPSFNVRPSHGTFHCFGCGEGGSVIDFVMKVEHLGFVEAVERLADKVSGYTEDQFQKLDEALAKLSPDQREILVLSRYQGLKYEEISRIKDISVAAIKVQVFRAIKQLRHLYFKQT